MGTDKADKRLDEGLLSVLAGQCMAHADDDSMWPSTATEGTPLGVQAVADGLLRRTYPAGGASAEVRRVCWGR
jgi:hypothetical protein